MNPAWLAFLCGILVGAALMSIALWLPGAIRDARPLKLPVPRCRVVRL